MSTVDLVATRHADPAIVRALIERWEVPPSSPIDAAGLVSALRARVPVLLPRRPIPAPKPAPPVALRADQAELLAKLRAAFPGQVALPHERPAPPPELARLAWERDGRTSLEVVVHPHHVWIVDAADDDDDAVLVWSAVVETLQDQGLHVYDPASGDIVPRGP